MLDGDQCKDIFVMIKVTCQSFNWIQVISTCWENSKNCHNISSLVLNLPLARWKWVLTAICYFFQISECHLENEKSNQFHSKASLSSFRMLLNIIKTSKSIRQKVSKKSYHTHKNIELLCPISNEVEGAIFFRNPWVCVW